MLKEILENIKDSVDIDNFAVEILSDDKYLKEKKSLHINLSKEFTTSKDEDKSLDEISEALEAIMNEIKIYVTQSMNKNQKEKLCHISVVCSINDLMSD